MNVAVEIRALEASLRELEQAVQSTKWRIKQLRLGREYQAQVVKKLDHLRHDSNPQIFAAKYHVDLGLVEHRLERLKDAEILKDRERRNRKMRQLAQKGWTNREIGQVYKLHPVTVSRIVNRRNPI